MKRSIFVACCTLLALAVAPAALAHDHRTVGRFDTTVGWLDEPTYAGFRNAVVIAIERLPAGDEGHDHAEGAEHAEGTPVKDAELKVEVIFGDENGTQRMPPVDMQPSPDVPGEYRAPLIPTRAGVYTFHFTGTIGGTQFDEYYTAGEKTFAVVEQPAEIEFPAKDPTREQLAQRVAAVDEKASEVDGVRVFAIAAIAFGVAAIAFAIGALRGRA